MLEAVKKICPDMAAAIISEQTFKINNIKFKIKRRFKKKYETVHRDSDNKLEVRSKAEIKGSTIIISRTLKNISTTLSESISTLEPLHLKFSSHLFHWRHLTANGGSTEQDYPPAAYRNHIWPGDSQSVNIKSHIGGTSSMQHLPFIISENTKLKHGFFCSMEWSGQWHIKFTAGDVRKGLTSGNLGSVFRAGPDVDNMVLVSGETIELPEVHLGFFKGGLESGTTVLRKYLYKEIVRLYDHKPTLPLVSYDHFFGIGDNINFEIMSREASRAAEMGVEVFVVDAGWFPGGFPNGVGNWVVDEKKFPERLERLSSYVRSLGMNFGLWFEPERAAEGTIILKEHPEWFIPVDSWTSKQSYHINLAIPEAQDYLIETVSEFISRLDIRWSRWDYNIDFTPFIKAVDPTGKIQFAYMKGLYRVLDILMARHPKWMVEECAGGGRRLDIGTMKRAHTYWFSDHTKYPEACRYMQSRANRFLPGNLLNSTVPVGRGNGDKGLNKTSVLSRMLGKISFDGDIASLSPKFTKEIAGLVKEFKNLRHLFVKDFYQLLPQPIGSECWDGSQFIDYKKKESAVFVFSGEKSGGERYIRLKGLNPKIKYKIKSLVHKTKTITITANGRELMDKGFLVKLKNKEGCLWRIKAGNK
jgi:alpha-galactosidase